MAIYVDDIFITASTFDLCLHYVFEVIKLFDDLGFHIQIDKSNPPTVLTVLGFVIDSLSMTVTLTD